MNFIFVCVCPAYNEIRQELYTEITNKCNMFSTFNELEIFIYIKNDHQKALSIYLVKAWLKREEYCYHTNFSVSKYQLICNLLYVTEPVTLTINLCLK